MQAVQLSPLPTRSLLPGWEGCKRGQLLAEQGALGSIPLLTTRVTHGINIYFFLRSCLRRVKNSLLMRGDIKTVSFLFGGKLQVERST